MPDERRLGIVEHPLNDARGGVPIAAIGLEHGALAVIGHRLCLALIIVEGTRSAVAAIEPSLKTLTVVKRPPPAW